MISEDDAREYYSEFLGELRQLGAQPLAQEIERTVLRGALRNEGGPNAKELAYQTPLSPREALMIALRMFLSALDPAFHVAEVQKTFGALGDDRTGPVQVTWLFDRVAPTEGRDALEADLAALGDLEPLPLIQPQELGRLWGPVEHLVSLLREVQAELERTWPH